MLNFYIFLQIQDLLAIAWSGWGVFIVASLGVGFGCLVKRMWRTKTKTVDRETQTLPLMVEEEEEEEEEERNVISPIHAVPRSIRNLRMSDESSLMEMIGVNETNTTDLSLPFGKVFSVILLI